VDSLFTCWVEGEVAFEDGTFESLSIPPRSFLPSQHKSFYLLYLPKAVSGLHKYSKLLHKPEVPLPLDIDFSLLLSGAHSYPWLAILNSWTYTDT
jgi:hypothetical protein